MFCRRPRQIDCCFCVVSTHPLLRNTSFRQSPDWSRFSKGQADTRGLWVKAEDLIHSCPIWHCDYLRIGETGSQFRCRTFAMRKRWSHKMLLINPPISVKDLPVDDCHTLMQRLAYGLCRSTVFWEVVGPAEFLCDPVVFGPSPGPRLVAGGAFAHDEILARHSFRLFLCQHEIRGD